MSHDESPRGPVDRAFDAVYGSESKVSVDVMSSVLDTESWREVRPLKDEIMFSLRETIRHDLVWLDTGRTRTSLRSLRRRIRDASSCH